VMWGSACLTVLVSIVANARKVDQGGRLGLEIHPNRHRHHQHDVFLAGFFPTTLGYHETSIGQGVMPAVKLALHDVNRSPDILKNHHLRMHWNNTACNPGVGLRSFFELVHNGPKKVILFGGACSMVTDQIVKAARHWNLVQVTYADTHPMFTAKSFPHFFRVVPSENQFNQPRLALLKQFNWTRVGTLYQNQAKYSLAHNDLIRQLRSAEFEVVLSQSFNDELTTQVDALQDKDNDIRIILGNFNESWARAVFCEAWKKGLYGDKIQWLIVGMYEDQWWNTLEKGVDCTPLQILQALQGTMVMEIQPISSCSPEDQKNKECKVTVSQKTAGEYEDEYLASTRETGRRHNANIYSRFHGYAYDGIWAIARAIEAVEEESKAFNETLVDFQYKDAKWEKRFIRALNRTSFEGVTGPVQFKDNSRRGNVLINQIIGEDETCIGEYSGVTRTLHMERCNPVVWPKNKTKPPKDRTYTRIEQTRVNPTVYIILCVASAMGIILGFAFLGINIKYRHQKQIKMSSPNLNNLIIVGCILCYSSVIILGLDSSITSEDAFPYICTAKAWVLMAGFTLSFGSMFSKTWRVHSIFTNVQLNKKVMRDSQLFLVVAVLLGMDITIMTTWQLADPFYREVQALKAYAATDKDDTEFIVIPRNENCKSDKMTIFVGVIYAYKGLLLLFGAFLAWETRNVQIPALNDSKYVGMSLYNVTIMCVLGVAISAVLDEQKNASFAIISIFIIFCTTATLCLVFVPKLIELRRNPHGAPSKQPKGAAPVKVKNDLTSLDDKFRIANKVNAKFLEAGSQKTSILEDLYKVVGVDTEKVLENSFDFKKNAHVSFANDKQEQSSTTSERTTTQMDSGVESSNSDSNRRADGLLNDQIDNLQSQNENNNNKLENSSVGCTSTNNNLIARSSAVTAQNGVRPDARNPISSTHPPAEGTCHSPEEVQQFGSESEARSQHHHLAVTELSASFDGVFATNKNEAIAHQRLYEAQRDLSPMYQKQPECCSQAHKMHLSDHHGRSAQSYGTGLDSSQKDQDESSDCHSNMDRRQSCPSYDPNLPKTRMAVKEMNSSSAVSPESYRHYTPEYFEGSSSTLSSVSEDLYCSARADKTYYRVDPGDNVGQSTREDQATQTDDEADIDTPKKIARPTSFSCGKDFRGQVRSQEELSRKETLLGSIIDLQNHSGFHEGISKPFLCKTGSLCYPNPSRSCHSASFSTHHLNGLDSQQIVPIFHKLLEDKCIPSPESSPSCPSNMKSCPNIAVRCDIVEYL